MGSCASKQNRPRKCELISQPVVSQAVFTKSKKYLGVHSQYTFTKVIGHGQFGTVREAFRRSDADKKTFAIKSISKKNLQNNSKSLKREFKIMRIVNHVNIVRLYEAYEDQLFLHLVMENCTGGNIFERISQNGPFSEENASNLMKQLLETVEYLHSNNIAHRDLKPENLMYESVDSELVKICDFGTSIISSENNQLYSLVGTPYYLAPEVVDRRYSKSCDVWSLGIILYFVLIGLHPFRGRTTKTVFTKALQGYSSIDTTEFSHLSDQVKDLLKKMLCPNDRRRITSKQALDHPWFKSNSSKTCVPNYVLNSVRKFNSDVKFWDLVLISLIERLTISQIEEFCESIFSEIQKGKILANLQDLLRLLQESGINEGKEYLESAGVGNEEMKNGEISLEELGKVLKKIKNENNEEDVWRVLNEFGFGEIGVNQLEELLNIVKVKKLMARDLEKYSDFGNENDLECFKVFLMKL